MIDTKTHKPMTGEEPLLEEAKKALASGLEDRLGGPVRIIELRSKFLDTFSTHPISRLHLTFGSGDRLTVIFKRLQPRPDRDIGRRILIYRRLMSDERLDAPAVYATVGDEVQGQYWVFLEDVGATRLDWCDEDDWLAAFRWLGKMNAAYLGRQPELRALGCLGEHGPAFYGSLAHTARDIVRRFAGGRRLARFERRMARWFDVSVACLAGGPHTLVHGDLYGTNIMVQPGPRIRPIDWESAAIGVAGWDMAHLLAGWGAKKPRMIAAYLDAFAQCAPAPPERRAFERTLAHCEMMRVLRVTCSWEGPYDSLGFIDGLLEEMELACHRMEELGGSE